MYGLVNKAIHDMVCRYHGDEVWSQIKQLAELQDEDLGFFISMESYPDDVTHRLVGAACRVLGMSSAEILQAFGEYWVTYTAEEGYGELLNSAGESLPEFIENLDNLHARVGLSFPKLQPPSFECEHANEAAMDLHYHSQRQGLAPMVVGLLQGLGQRFDTKVEVRQTQSREQGDDHDVFSIHYSNSTTDDG